MNLGGMTPLIFENRLLKLLCYLIPYLIVGKDVVKNAFRGILKRDPFDEAFLMTLATFGAFAVGEDSEAVAVMLFYAVGELFQDVAVGKSRKSIKALMEIAPEFANLLLPDGTAKTVDPSDLKVGDTILIKAGERVPVDGMVLEGSSMIDTKAITGESVPRKVKAGEEIISGCINGEGLLRVRVEKAYEDSTVAKILDLVENASEKKSKTENFITRFARVYTPVVVVSALVLAVVPPIVTGTSFLMWIQRACIFLVISCPCALVLSVPLSFFGGIGAASRIGVLVKGSNYLEALGEMETLVSDKTGTLTKGEFRVTRILPAKQDAAQAEGLEKKERETPKTETPESREALRSEEAPDKTAADSAALLELAALSESFSDHPIANSIREAFQEERQTEPDASRVTDTTNVSGQGIRAVIDGHTVLAGNDRMMRENNIAFPETKLPGTVVYLAKDGVYQGCLIISDVVKPEAKEAIAALKAAGVKRTVMLTGDRKEAADAVGEALGMDLVYSELLPGDKVEKVEALSESGGKGKLAFIGDGINDAPVLARADIGIAMGSMGSDAAIEAADVVIMDDNLMRISAVIRIARKTLHIARENIVFALGVKLIVLVLGALGLANMWAAVFADVGVSVICILNSMRMLRAK